MTPAVVVIANPEAGHLHLAWRDQVVRILSELGQVEFVTPSSPAGCNAVMPSEKPSGLNPAARNTVSNVAT